MRNRFLNISDIYILLIMLQQLQDVIYKGGTIFSKLLIVLCVGISIIYTLYANFRFKLPIYFKGLNILLVLFSLYGIWHIVASSGDYVWSGDKEVSSYSYLLSIYISLLPIYVFYIATIRGHLDTPKIQALGVLFIAISIAKFYTFQADSTDTRGVDEITNNFGYLFAGAIPLLFYYKDKKILQFTLLALCFIMTVLSIKRGAILIVCISILPFVFKVWKQGNNITRLSICIISIISLLGAGYFIQYLLNTSEYFVARIQATLEGNSSLRDELLRKMWDFYKNKASLQEQILGGGANYTLQVADNYAHNDWMELLINQGILGVIVYAIYWIKFYKTYRRYSHNQDLQLESSSLLIALVASFILTLFSMSYSNLQICMTMAIGFSLGKISQYEAGIHD